MASQEIIFGAMISAPGRYQLCFVTHGEDGEIHATRRNVVINQHGPFFYMQFADSQFKPYPCGHEGLRCDLIDASAGWFVSADEDAEESQQNFDRTPGLQVAR